jgi:hypothetical protein
MGAIRGQWNVEEPFRRAKKGGIAPQGLPSHQWVDHSLRLHAFATAVGLTLVSLVRLTLGNRKSARLGRPSTVMLGPDVTAEQRKAIKVFELDRWMPALLSSIHQSVPTADPRPAE